MYLGVVAGRLWPGPFEKLAKSDIFTFSVLNGCCDSFGQTNNQFSGENK